MKETLLFVLQLFTIVAAVITVILGIGELYAKKAKHIYKIKKSTLIVSAITAISAIFMFYLDTNIENEKDRVFKKYQAESKEKVAEINVKATNAQKNSDSLKVVAYNLSLQNKKLAYKIKIAEKEIQLTKNQTLVLEGKNTELAYKLEQENLERRKLYTALSPRLFEQFEFSNYIGKIKNIKIIMESINNEEAIQTAGQLRFIFAQAGWNIIKDIIIDEDEHIWDGITIYRHVGPTPKNDYTEKATDALLTQLKSNNMKASSHPDELEINTLRVVVGIKPFNLRKFILEWASEQTFDRFKLKESILKYMTTYNSINALKLSNTYSQGYILFFIDVQNNIVPLGSELSKLYSLNWDKASVQYDYKKSLMFKIPEIIEKKSNFVISTFFDDIELKSGEKISKTFNGSGYIKHNIVCNFSQLELIESGILCVVGITETGR